MVFLGTKTRMCQYQLPSIGNLNVHPVDHSLNITTGVLVDFAFCVNITFFYTLK